MLQLASILEGRSAVTDHGLLSRTIDCPGTRQVYGVAGSKAECCRNHVKDGMVGVARKRCTHPSCTKGPSYGVAGSKAEYRRDHVKDGMLGVASKRCAHPGRTIYEGPVR